MELPSLQAAIDEAKAFLAQNGSEVFCEMRVNPTRVASRIDKLVLMLEAAQSQIILKDDQIQRLGTALSNLLRETDGGLQSCAGHIATDAGEALDYADMRPDPEGATT